MPRVRQEPHQRSTHPYEGNELLRGLFIRAKNKKHRQLPLTPPGRQQPGPHAAHAMPTPIPAVPGLALRPSAQLPAAEVKRPVGSRAGTSFSSPGAWCPGPTAFLLTLQASVSTQPQDDSLLHVPQDPPMGQSGLPPVIGGDRQPECGALLLDSLGKVHTNQRDGAGAISRPPTSGVGCTHHPLAECPPKSSLKGRLRLRGRAAVGGRPARAAVRFCLDWAPHVF